MSSFEELLGGLDDLKIVSEAGLVFTTVFLALRLWTRARILRSFSTDDWFMIPCWLAAVGTMISGIYLVSSVDGMLHGNKVQLDEIGKLIRMATAFYALSILFLKLSLGAFFLRVFSILRFQRTIIYTVVGISTILTLVSFVLSAATCGASGGFFQSTSVSSCNVGRVYSIITTIWSYVNAVGDFIFAALAVDAIRRAQMKMKTKIIAALVLVIGTSGGVASLIRVSIITKKASVIGPSHGLAAGKLTIVEIGVGMTAANLACLRPLLRKLQETFSTSISSAQPTGASRPAQSQMTKSKAPTVTTTFMVTTAAADEEQIETPGIEQERGWAKATPPSQVDEEMGTKF